MLGCDKLTARTCAGPTAGLAYPPQRSSPTVSSAGFARSFLYMWIDTRWDVVVPFVRRFWRGVVIHARSVFGTWRVGVAREASSEGKEGGRRCGADRRRVVEFEGGLFLGG